MNDYSEAELKAFTTRQLEHQLNTHPSPLTRARARRILRQRSEGEKSIYAERLGQK